METEAAKVRGGQLVRTTVGGVIKVLTSNPERQSAASASFGMWEIVGYREGEPTYRITCAPSDLIEVVG